MRETTSRGYRIAYQVAGNGPPLMLVPGWSQSAARWINEGYVRALEDRFRVVAIDPLGHGESDRPHDPDAYLWASVIEDLLAVADAERIDQPIWWGFSRGAALVRDLAYLHPRRVGAVVMGSAAETGGWPDIPFPDLCRSEGGLEQVWMALGLHDVDTMREARSRNDAEALACLAEGTGPYPAFQRFPRAFPLLSYKGGLERYAASTIELLRQSAAQLHEVVGANHYEAFVRTGDVLAFVEPFLASVT